jgi:3-phosphoshikimate 1-carboxyvinyltransferase
MIAHVHPSKISGTIVAAASKSCMQRACAAALLAEGATTIINPGISNDDLAALDIIQKLGARVVNNDDGTITIHSIGVAPASTEINCGESGLSVRMFTPIAALSNQPLTINGTGSLLRRPLDFFDEIFPQLQIKIESNSGMLPLQIQGPLKPAAIEVDGSLSSQFLTGLLMAYGAAATEPTTITVKDLKSKPYIDLTLQVMDAFGRKVTHENYEHFHIEPQAINYSPQMFTVESDWSGAAFLLVAGAMAGDIIVKGLNIESAQADKAVLEALKDSGCKLSIEADQINIGPAQLQAFSFDATDCPDLFPPLVALAAYCNGTTSIKGITRLTHKESNRAITLQQEFAKLGIEIILQDDLMLINGTGKISGAKVHSRHDHRIAMACAVAALKATGEVIIEEAEAVNKSYPNFYEHLQKLGATVLVD